MVPSFVDQPDSTTGLAGAELAALRGAARSLAAQDGTGIPRDTLVALAAAATRPLTLFAPDPGSDGPVLAVAAPPRPGADPVFAPLTVREREVATLLAAGRSNREIARQLGVTVGTTKDHVHRILAKTGLASRAEVGAAWRGPAR